MKKINILKWIIDLLWIFSMPVVLIIIGISFATFFVDLNDLSIAINALDFNANSTFSKILFVISSLNYLLLIVALYFFRKVLTNFLRVRVFEEVVISS
ncbi:MAG: hypothetical protein ACI8VJ_001006, partial [Polaribacter sp.]